MPNPSPNRVVEATDLPGPADLARELDLDPDLCHLNHAAVGPWPRRTVQAVQRFAADNGRRGSEAYPEWLAVERRLRERLARLIGAADPLDIALAKSTSEALSVIAYGLPWEPGDEVLGIAEEFPSNRIVWESLADRGVHWQGLSLAHSRDPEGDLIARCGPRTRLMAVSWVQYARGLRLDLGRLGSACRERGVLLCVDAIQGLGALPFDLATARADFVVADGHKWMLGPEGLALLYVRPELRETLALHQFGWNMVEQRGDYERHDWRAASDARRFECGSPNLLGIHALEASLSLIEDAGIERIATAIGERVDHAIRCADERGLEVLSPRDSGRRGGILTFAVPNRDPMEVYRKLMARRVLCAQRGGGIRFSPHFYTPVSIIDSAFERLDKVLTGGIP